METGIIRRMHGSLFGLGHLELHRIRFLELCRFLTVAFFLLLWVLLLGKTIRNWGF